MHRGNKGGITQHYSALLSTHHLVQIGGCRCHPLDELGELKTGIRNVSIYPPGHGQGGVTKDGVPVAPVGLLTLSVRCMTHPHIMTHPPGLPALPVESSFYILL